MVIKLTVVMLFTYQTFRFVWYIYLKSDFLMTSSSSLGSYIFYSSPAVVQRVVLLSLFHGAVLQRHAASFDVRLPRDENREAWRHACACLEAWSFTIWNFATGTGHSLSQSGQAIYSLHPSTLAQWHSTVIIAAAELLLITKKETSILFSNKRKI